MTSTELSDGRLVRGSRSRERILSAAAALASTDGLQTLTIAGLAERTQMSKSGLFAHFGSKQQLQLATVEHARRLFIGEVAAGPAGQEGIELLRALCARWLDYSERCPFPGGCFFMAVTLEYKNQGGPVRDRVNALMASWLSVLEDAAEEAVRRGELGADVSPAQLVFELNGAMLAATWAFHVMGDASAWAHARSAVELALS